MIALFNSIVQFFGLMGVFKYIMDQASINAVHQMLTVLHENSKKGGGAPLTDADRQKLLTDVSRQVWDRVLGTPEPTNTEWVAQKTLPGGVVDLASCIAYPFKYAYHKVSGKGLAQAGTARDRACQMAIQGMWSFLLPACLAMLSANLLVREIEFVQVESENDYYSNLPDRSERLVKRIMFGGGKLSFSIPHNPFILVTAQFIVGISVFQLVSLLLLVLAYTPGQKPSGPSA